MTGCLSNAGANTPLRDGSNIIEKCYPLSFYADTANATAGQMGVLASGSINGPANPSFTEGVIYQPAYPSRIRAEFRDVTTADTLVCTTLNIWGIDQFGVPRKETMSVNETAVACPANSQTAGTNCTRHVYAKLTNVTTAGCSGASEAGDELVLATSLEVGLTAKLHSKHRDIWKACIKDASDSNEVKCAQLNDGTAADVESAWDSSTNSLDFSTAMFAGSVAGADDDEACVTFVGR